MELPQALIPHESRIAYTLSQESTPTSIVELLRNHVFHISDPRFLWTVCHLVRFSAQSEASNSRPIEEFLADSKRHALLVLSLFTCFSNFYCLYHVKCLFVFAGPYCPC